MPDLPPHAPPDILSPLRKPVFRPAAAIFALMGAFFWAIRGTDGFGGSQGGILAGLGWAMLWLGFSRRFGDERRRPYGHGHVVAAILLGIACGGLTGYGVYISWVQGRFHLDYPDGVREIAPWTGYAMLFFCGLHWGGLTGVFMAWCAPRRPLGATGWMGRLAAGLVGAGVAYGIVVAFPAWFLPFHDEGLYADPANKTCLRAAGSIRNIAPHVGAYVGFLAFEALRRDARAVAVMSIMGLGFALSFSLGAVWQTFYGIGPDLDWWKFWEMSIGVGGGLTFALVFHRFNRPDASVPPRPVTVPERVVSAGALVWLATATVLANGLDGWSRRHGVEIPPTFGQVAGILIAAALGFLHLRSPERMTPRRLIPLALGAIVVAGFATSLPPELRLADQVLLLIYLICVAGSLGCFLWLRRI